MSERTPLSGREYAALQTLFAVVSTFTAGIDPLKKRAESIGLWEDLKRIGDDADHILSRIALTVPENKLRHIRMDLDNIRLYIKIQPPGLTQMTSGFSYTPTAALNGLLNFLCQHECCLCDKTAVEARHCEYRQLIDDALPHEVEGKDREHCKYSDMVLGL